eukprot:3483823-Pyramimonas_sp.AAC.1
MGPAGSVKLLRRAVVGVIMESVDHYPDAEPLRDDHADIIMRDRLLDLCLSSNAVRDRQRKSILKRYLNGGICSDRIAIFGPVKSLRSVSKAVAYALVPCALKPFLRHRWCTSLTNISEATLLLNVCGIGRRALPQWLTILQRSDRVEAAKPMIAPPGDGDATATTDWAEQNRQVRVTCKEWVATAPAPRLLCLLAAMTPMARGHCNLARIGGTPWEEEQMANSLEGASRLYRVLEAHLGNTTE